MTDTNQKQLGSTLWSIADQLRGAMDADDFRDYMLSFRKHLIQHHEASRDREWTGTGQAATEFVTAGCRAAA
jgi:type I restriction enzyme M protein